MISFFRRALSSWIILALLGLVLVAFIVTGVSAPGMNGGGATDGGTAAKVGDSKISSVDLLRRIQNQFEGARRQQPALTQKIFVDQGGFEGVTDAFIRAKAVESWGREHGFAIGKRLIDAEVAGVPAFKGVTGQFDEAAMRGALAQARMSERDMRADFASDLLRGQILAPISAPVQGPAKAADPYARLLIELRTGQVGVIPLGAVADTRPPSDAEVAAAYKANIAAYTRPEARVLRYALFGPAQVAAQVAPSDAEIAEYYRDNAASYAAKESRDLSQLITPSEATARSVAAAAKAGGSLAAAASKAGLEAATLKGQDRAAYAGSSSAAVATAAFAAPKGGVVGPIKGAFGWYVVHVDAVTGTPARTLDQAKPEIVALLTKEKAETAMQDLSGKIEDAIADGSSFAEVAAANKLAVIETPAILSSGQPIDRAGWQAPPETAALLKSGFAAESSDRPTVETVVPDQQFALLSVAKVVPPLPLPLAQVRTAVVRDIIVKRTAARAKAVANQVAAAVNKGTPLAKALAATGVKLPPAQPARARQVDLARAQQANRPVPAAVRALFTLKKGQAKVVPSDDGAAIFVTVLETTTPGDVAKEPGLIDNTRRELSQAYNAELGEQFVRAIELDVSIKRNADAIAAVKRQFAGNP